MNPVDGLRDIRGLDAVGWWPPAPGWWLIALLFVVVVVLLVRLRRRRRRGWEYEARALMRDLRGRAEEGDPRGVAGELSELLRRIAMVRFGRQACAGLTGSRWLEWLEAHDPASFPWTRSGRALVDLPYAPEGGRVDGAALHPLFQAAESWLAAGTGPGSGPGGSGPPVRAGV